MVFAILELTIGIIAASLPTLKAIPFLHWLFDTARALTYGSNSQARPYNASFSGYFKPRGRSASPGDAYNLGPMSKDSSHRGNGKEFYQVHITCGSRDEIDSNLHWEDPYAKTSDDSILPRQNPWPETGIMRTTEVKVSNSRRSASTRG
ncbi:MAG: hypothetical protein Q9227_004633 [Pyrenula ochraceoflavens]